MLGLWGRGCSSACNLVVAASCCRPGSGFVVTRIGSGFCAEYFGGPKYCYLSREGGGTAAVPLPAAALRWGASPEEAGAARGGFSSAAGKGEKRPGKVEAASAEPPLCLGSPAQPRPAPWCTARLPSRPRRLLSVTLQVYWDRFGKYQRNEAASISPKEKHSGGCRSACLRG